MFVWFPLFVFPNIPLSATKSEENLIRYASNHIKSYQIVSIDDLDRRYQYSTLSSTEVLPWQETFTQTHKETWFRAGGVRYRGWARRVPGTRYQLRGTMVHADMHNTSPDLPKQARSCKYNPRPAYTSPAVQMQAQACKSKPRLATTSPGL